MDMRIKELCEHRLGGSDPAGYDCMERPPVAPKRLVAEDVNAAFDRANALANAGRLDEAVDLYLACVRAVPRFAAGYGALSEALRELGVLDHAKAMAQQAVALAPDSVEALIVLGGRHFDLGEFEDAARLYGEALALDPAHAGVQNNLANALHNLGEYEAALALHDLCLETEPENATYRYNRSLTMLAMGDFVRGWAEHEWRRRPELPDLPAGTPWRGEDPTGRRILLIGEQGFGDTLQFVRYAPLVAARGAQVVLQVQPGLERLLRTMPGIAHVVARDDPRPDADMHCLLMSLPWVFGTRPDTIPASLPYVRPPPDLRAAWRIRMAEDQRFRVGVAWAGGSHRDDIGSHIIDRRRSIAAERLAPLGDIRDVRFYSLQKDRDAAPPIPGMIDLMPAVTDFADTAALVAELDLVIAVDTSVAHLAGAMGKPVWLLSRSDSCWRWLGDRADSPWYPTMRIYRQRKQGDWAEVLARVAADLERHVQARAGAEPAGGLIETMPAR